MHNEIFIPDIFLDFLVYDADLSLLEDIYPSINHYYFQNSLRFSLIWLQPQNQISEILIYINLIFTAGSDRFTINY
jgi:hypothetical protein